MATKYVKKTDDPFLDWLVKAPIIKRTVWIIESQLYRLELMLKKNNYQVDEESREMCNIVRGMVSQLIMHNYKHDMELRSNLTRLARHRYIVADYVLEFNAKRGRV